MPFTTSATTYAPPPGAMQAKPLSETQAARHREESETERLLKTLRDHIDKGPIVALREKILKAMNLTEEKLKALPAEQQNATELEIARKIKEFLLERKEKVDDPTSTAQAGAKRLAAPALSSTPR